MEKKIIFKNSIRKIFKYSEKIQHIDNQGIKNSKEP